MKICHNCGRELENTIKNCIRCNEEQLDDAVIFKAQPKPPLETKSKTTTQPNTPTDKKAKNNTPTSAAPPYVQVQQEAVAQTTPINEEVKDESGLVSPFGDGSTTPSIESNLESNLDNTTTENVVNDKDVDAMLDDIISDEYDRDVKAYKLSNDTALLVLLILIFVIVIVIVQPYIENSISSSKPTYTNVTSVAPVADTTEILTHIGELENDDVLEGEVSELFPEFDYINKTIQELKEFYNEKIIASNNEDYNQSTKAILGKDYLIQITTDTDYIIKSVNYTANYDATAENLNESISLINQIAIFLTQEFQSPVPIIGIPIKPLEELTFENLTQDGFVEETFKSSYAIDDNNIVIVTVKCTLVDGVYTLVNSIDFEEANLLLGEILTDDNVGGDVLNETPNITTLNESVPTESPYTQAPAVTLTSM